MLDLAGDYIDIVKLGWGTSYVTGKLGDKLRLYRAAGIPMMTRRDAARGRHRAQPPGRVPALDSRAWLHARRGVRRHHRSGAGPQDRADRVAGRGLTSCSRRSARRTPSGSTRPYQWVAWIKEELEAGAHKVITEARESGTCGHLPPERRGALGPDRRDRARGAANKLLFEAPQKEQQAWFISTSAPTSTSGTSRPPR